MAEDIDDKPDENGGRKGCKTETIDECDWERCETKERDEGG